MIDLNTPQLASLLVIGLAGLFMSLRPYLVLSLGARWRELSNNLAHHLSTNHCHESDYIRQLITAASTMEVLGPIFAVCPPPVMPRMSDVEKDIHRRVINRNAWLLPYLWEGNALLNVTLFLGRPLKPEYFVHGLKAIFALIFLRRKEGGLKLFADVAKQTILYDRLVYGAAETKRDAESKFGAHSFDRHRHA